ALELVDRGLALARDAGDVHALTALRAELLCELGRAQEALDAFADALARAPDDAARCRAHTGMAAALRRLDRYPAALAELDLAEGLARRLGRDEVRTRIHSLRGSVYFPLGHVEGCLAEHGEALALARAVGSARDEARALSGLGD